MHVAPTGKDKDSDGLLINLECSIKVAGGQLSVIIFFCIFTIIIIIRLTKASGRWTIIIDIPPRRLSGFAQKRNR